MKDHEQPLKDFVIFASGLDGDENGEAQVFCDRLFRAFGWPGLKEAGATLEPRILVKGAKGKITTKFADLLWPSKLLIEMKRRGEKLEQHYQQAFEYWQHIVPHRPRYVMLCNFDEFWVYDLNNQLYDPVDRVRLVDLPDRYPALNFLFPDDKEPLFGNNRIAVTREAADRIAALFNALVDRQVDREQAQRFVLQCVVAMFANSIGLLPRGLFVELIQECQSKASTFDLFGDLFRWMNSRRPAREGRFKSVPYFNGGLFAVVDPIGLTKDELKLLADAAQENWSKVQPAVFGTLFQSSMGKDLRHALGAHFTSEAEIQRIVHPTIVKPWRERIAAASTMEELSSLRAELEQFRVLDPACGSGNFLYVAYRELVRIEMALVKRLWEEFSSARAGKRKVASASFVSLKQFHGIDINSFATELAKVTMLLGKKLAYDEVTGSLNVEQVGLEMEAPLPLDNLDEQIVCQDALLSPWPKVDAIIGNPPYQSKSNIQEEYGADYANRIRSQYPDVPGRADYCVYWFRRAHDELEEGKRAGLVGTNTIRQNYSREGGLDYIVQNGGTITEAVSTQVWPGDAVVHVSIVNWIKGTAEGKKRLFTQIGDHVDSPWKVEEVDRIQPALSALTDVTQATSISANIEAGVCYQGQTHGHEGFLLKPDEARALIKEDPASSDVLFPFLIGDDLVGRAGASPSRYVIDFHPLDLLAARRYKALFQRIHGAVLPARTAAAEREAQRNKQVHESDPKARVNMHHQNFLKRWWLLSYPREELIQKINKVSRYIACSRVTRRPIFEFVSSLIRPNDKVQVFVLPDDYSFGIISSSLHWEWFKARCTTLKADFNYNGPAIWDTFPWPQNSTVESVKVVAKRASDFRALRRRLAEENGMSLRQLYATVEDPGEHPLKRAQAGLDASVRAAYGMRPQERALGFLLKLNSALAKREAAGEKVIGPGLPPHIRDPKPFITSDCVRPPTL